MKTSIVVCTKDSSKLERLKKSINDCGLYKEVELIPVHKAKSMATGYNNGAIRAKYPMLVFMHEDVQLRCSKVEWLRFLAQLRSPWYGIGGVVGSRCLAREKVWPPIGGFGSGGILHTSRNKTWYTTMGLFGTCLWLDGCFLAMRRELYDELEGFDESIPGFHWYDVDISLRAHLLAYRNFTYPLQIMHQMDNYDEHGVRKDLRAWFDSGEIFWKKHEGLYPMTIACDDPELERMVFSREPRWGNVA